MEAIRSNNTLMDTLTLIRLCGDINGDGILSSVDITFLASFLFGGGPIPPHVSAADVNGDLTVNVSDLIYLVFYLFEGGVNLQCP
jgi:hypothetical protein